MSIVIQKKQNSVNVLNTDLAAGQQIEITMPPNCVARQQGNHSIIEFLSIDRKVLKSVPFDGVQYQDLAGVATAWSGNFDDFLNKLNNEYFDEKVTVSISGVSTSAKQDEQLQQATDYFSKKNIGKIIDLANTSGGNSWGGYPLNLVAPPSFSFVFNFGTDFEISAPLAAVNATDLVSILNNTQDYISFSVISETSLLMNDGTKTLNNLASITIDTSNFGDLLYDSFADSPAVPLSNLDVISENIKKQLQVNEAILQIEENREAVFLPFSSSNPTTVSLATANNEYLLCAYRLKPNVISAKVNNIHLSVQSLSNDNLRVRLGINKTLNAAIIEANWVEVDANSNFQVARIGVAGLTTKTATGFSTGGRDIRQVDIIQNQGGIADTGEIIAVQGIVFYITAEPRSNGGLTYDIQEWSEKQA